MTLLYIICGVLIAICVIMTVLYIRSLKRAGEADALRLMVSDERRLNSELTKRIEQQAAGEIESRKVNQLLTPLKQQIEQFNNTFIDSRVKDASARQILLERIDRLTVLNTSIGNEARALTEALRGNSKIQGDWGEAVLKRLLESAGLREGVNFEVQLTRDSSGRTLRNEDGDLLRPDVVILLPEGRKLIIDSKVSLSDYVRLQDCEDSELKKSILKRHVASVRRHVDELATKSYHKTVKGAAEQVLMFMPIEGAFLQAFAADATLWDYAYRKKVVIVSPAHLGSILHLVEQLWRQDNQNANAEEIARQAGLMYDRFVAFTEDFLKVQSALISAQRAYDDCAKRLASGHLSLMSRAEKLRELGAKTTKSIPEELI